MVFEKFCLALAPSSPLSTNIHLLNWEGRLEYFSITGKYTEYSGYIFLRAGGLGQGLAERKWEVPGCFFFFLPWLFRGMSAIWSERSMLRKKNFCQSSSADCTNKLYVAEGCQRKFKIDDIYCHFLQFCSVTETLLKRRNASFFWHKDSVLHC